MNKQKLNTRIQSFSRLRTKHHWTKPQKPKAKGQNKDMLGNIINDLVAN
jgi:hypothetical protein